MATVESADHLGWVEMRVLRDFMSTSSETWSYLRPDATTVRTDLRANAASFLSLSISALFGFESLSWSSPVKSFAALCRMTFAHVSTSTLIILRICLQCAPFQELISTHFFAVWNLLEFVLSTMRSRGFLNNVSNFPDDSYYTVNEEAVAKWVSAGWYGGPNLEAFARNVLDGWRLQLALGSRLEKYQLDEAQLAALVQLLFAHYGRQLMVLRT